jgi:DNA modification methylase
VRPYYEHGGITIYHGDCREISEAWLAADVLVTDPPYGMAYKSGYLARGIANDSDTSARDDALRLWGEKRPALVFGRWDCPHPPGARIALTWDKGDWPGMGDLKLPWGPSTEEIYVLGEGFVGRRSGSVIRVDRLTGNTIHPNEKPLALLARLIERCPDGVIADPFMGSGSTLVAVKGLGRRAIGIEIEEKYCEIAAKRLSQEVLPLTPRVAAENVTEALL